MQLLIDKIDADLVHALAEEGNMKVDDVSNYEEVKAAIIDQVGLRGEEGGGGGGGVSMMTSYFTSITSASVPIMIEFCPFFSPAHL